MKRSMVLAVAVALAVALVSQGVAQDAGQKKAAPAEKKMGTKASPAHAVMNPADIQWGDAPPIFGSGAKMAVLQGNPGKAGPYVVRLKVPDAFKVAAHWHPMTENLTVISGTFNLGMGDKLDEAKTTPMSAGAFASMPAKMHHFAWTKGETIVQVNGNGPFKLIYVDPADDPTKTQK
jgi:hypothetical protein